MQDNREERSGRHEVIYSDQGIKLLPSTDFPHHCDADIRTKCINEMKVENTVLRQTVYAVVEKDGKLYDLSCMSADSVEVILRMVEYSFV